MASKILVVSHGHPDHRPGGGEIAAYNLHQKLNKTTEFESAFFARHDNPELLHGGSPFSGTGREREVLFYSPSPDWFRFSQPDKSKVWRDFQEFLNSYQPDLVHFHHYLHLGLELFRQVKNHNPKIPVVLTLHEYCGICHNKGQMVRPHDNALCTESSPASCTGCFPQHTAQDFYLRQQFIKSHFAVVDRFISPSQFLAERYIDWGLPRERFSVIENTLAADAEAPVAALDSQDTDSQDTAMSTSALQSKVRLAFFGQINFFKGVDLLLESLDYLSAGTREQIQLEINGSGLDKQPLRLRKKIQRLVRKNKDVVQLRGAYRQSELDALMAMTDWAVIPSIWWENSPVVILEAQKNGVPVICSDIGGMAEKIEHGKTGLHFMARRAESLAQQISWVVANRDKQAEFSANMRAGYDGAESMRQHRKLYSILLENSDSGALGNANGEGGSTRDAASDSAETNNKQRLRAA